MFRACSKSEIWLPANSSPSYLLTSVLSKGSLARKSSLKFSTSSHHSSLLVSSTDVIWPSQKSNQRWNYNDKHWIVQCLLELNFRFTEKLKSRTLMLPSTRQNRCFMPVKMALKFLCSLCTKRYLAIYEHCLLITEITFCRRTSRKTVQAHVCSMGMVDSTLVFNLPSVPPDWCSSNTLEVSWLFQISEAAGKQTKKLKLFQSNFRYYSD